MASPPPVLRPLGKNGPLVPRIGFGTMGMGFPCSRTTTPIPDPERLALLDRAYEVGCTFWDSSDFYGDSESIIGKWLALNPEKRKDIFLATKFGAIKLENGFGFRGDAAYVPIACEQSLKTLGVDTIDLWYPHRLDGSTPVEHIVAEMVKLKEQGKIRYIGLSEVSSATLRRAHAVHPISCVQMEYSIFSTEIEDPKHNLLATCRELGVAVVAYSPFSRGLLSGGVHGPDDFEQGDIRRFYPRFSRENFPKNMVLVEAIKELGAKKGATVGQVALAWLLAQGDDIFPIPGTITLSYVEENFAAMHVALSPEETQHIRDLVDKASVFGDRWPDEHRLGLFADTPPVEGWKGEEKEVTEIGRVIVDKE
ncbi:Aldo/keto reductase [Thozetella sp. PMI_491]|nr:Aldo/keto reductase [Thozetella sp. PMI_491]